MLAAPTDLLGVSTCAKPPVAATSRQLRDARIKSGIVAVCISGNNVWQRRQRTVTLHKLDRTIYVETAHMVRYIMCF